MAESKTDTETTAAKPSKTVKRSRSKATEQPKRKRKPRQKFVELSFYFETSLGPVELQMKVPEGAIREGEVAYSNTQDSFQAQFGEAASRPIPVTPSRSAPSRRPPEAVADEEPSESVGMTEIVGVDEETGELKTRVRSTNVGLGPTPVPDPSTVGGFLMGAEAALLERESGTDG